MQNMKNERVSGSVQTKNKRKQSKGRRGSVSNNMTNYSAPGNGKFIKFEQMQQHLEVGGADLEKESAQERFQLHKNLMPKTTGS